MDVFTHAKVVVAQCDLSHIDLRRTNYDLRGAARGGH